MSVSVPSIPGKGRTFLVTRSGLPTYLTIQRNTNNKERRGPYGPLLFRLPQYCYRVIMAFG